MATGDVLPECTQGFNELNLEVQVVKSEMRTQDKVISKLTEGIEKIQEVNTNLLRMLALHDQKHEMHEKIEEDLDDDIKDLHSRITTSSRETQDKIDRLEKDLYDKIDELRKDIFTALTFTKDKSDEPKALGDKLKEVESWKYIIISIILILAWLAEHVNWKFLAQLFGQ